MIQGTKQLKMEDKVELTDNISEADALLALQSKLKKNSRIQAAAKSHDLPIYVTKVINYSLLNNNFHLFSTYNPVLLL